MDCLTAQSLISDAVDHEPVDSQQLAEAKVHCSGCANCSLFIRSLLVARNAPRPAPPADLVDRVMAAVRAEHEAEQQAIADAEAAAADLEASALVRDTTTPEAGVIAMGEPASDGTARAVSPVSAFQTWIRRRSQRELVVWASAAVLFVAVVGIGTVAGIRTMLPAPVETKSADTAAATMGGAAPNATTSAPEAADSALSQTAPAATAGSYVTVQGAVYVLSGPSTIATEGLTPLGTTVTSLGTGGTPVSHAVFSADDPDRAYVVDGTQVLSFDRVTRSFSGSTYQLMSAELSAYGQWPTLPSNIPAPTSEDGSPTFVEIPSVMQDAAVYRLASSDPSVGIAVAPGSATSDPAAGNPNWTWWAKIP